MRTDDSRITGRFRISDFDQSPIMAIIQRVLGEIWIHRYGGRDLYRSLGVPGIYRAILTASRSNRFPL